MFATLKMQGEAIVNATMYGKFRFSAIKDDKGKTLKLLKPLEGKLNEKLETTLVELDHFFLERPDLLTLYLILEKPSASAQHFPSTDRFNSGQQTITIDNVMAQLSKPLSAPGLDKIGKFTASLPQPGEADVEGALAIDFIGDRSKDRRRRIDTRRRLQDQHRRDWNGFQATGTGSFAGWGETAEGYKAAHRTGRRTPADHHPHKIGRRRDWRIARPG